MEEHASLRSRAEIAFAELLARRPNPSPEELDALRAANPELAEWIAQMQRDLEGLHLVIGPEVTHSGQAGAQDTSRPESIGDFRCIHLLGRGGMGEVWEAQDEALGRRVAIKFLRTGSETNNRLQQRFHREAQAASRAQHPGIVTVFATGEWRGKRYIVQELVPGGRTLRDEIDEFRRRDELPVDHARCTSERFVRLCAALATAHEAGVVHRDLKPQNILLTPQGDPKVADFGLASLVDDVSLSRPGEFLGTYLYTSPEQLQKTDATVDARSDVFSLGATLYECLTLRRPFDGESVREITRAIALDDPLPPHLIRKRLPQELSYICMKALEKRRAARYDSMTAFGNDLRRFLAHQPVSAHAPSTARRAWKWAQRHPTRASTLLVGLVALLAVSLLLWRSERLRGDAIQARAQETATNRKLSIANEGLLRMNADLERARGQAQQSATEAIEQAREATAESQVRQHVVDFLIGLFEAADPLKEGGKDPTARDLVALGVQRIRESSISEPTVRARLLLTIGSVYSNLGSFVEAHDLFAEAVSIADSLDRADHPVAVEARLGLASSNADLGRPREAAALLEPIVTDWRNVGRPDSTSMLQALLGLGIANVDLGLYQEADAYLAEAEELARIDPIGNVEAMYMIRDERAWLAVAIGDASRAESMVRADLEERAALEGTGSPHWFHALANLAWALQHLGQFEEAEATYRAALEEIERSVGANHPQHLLLRNNLASMWMAQGRYPEAEALLSAALEQRSGSYDLLDQGCLALRNTLATCLLFQSDLKRGEPMIRDLARDLEKVLGPDHPHTLMTRSSLASALHTMGRHAEAVEIQQSVVELLPLDSPERAGAESKLDIYRAASIAPATVAR